MFHCIENNQPRSLRTLLKYSSNKKLSTHCTINGQDVSLFLFAAQEGYIDCIKELLKYPSLVDINEKNPNGYSALHIAAQNGHLETIKVLTEFPGIDVQPRDNEGVFPKRNLSSSSSFCS